jgi:flagellar hook-basal body complex protein FliE
MSPISPINFPVIVQAPSLAQSTAQPDASFQNAFQAAIGHVEHANAVADGAVQKFVSGEDQELHSTILATQNAELQFEMLMQVRNKVVSAYEEIMKMQL